MNFRKRDPFKGHRGKVLRKKLYAPKKKSYELIDEELKAIDESLPKFDSSRCKLFTDFPISKKTLKGLSASKYEVPTDIQRESIALALGGNDILGAAKTGSGKTLAFIIPVLECLYRMKWTQFDGLGALVISPTRELAFQTFEVLKKVGKFHDFSAGLVIGGKPLKEEAGRINRTNIVICTPGRLLQHMDETSYFTADSLKMLVLDEADRILDLGFAQTMNAIIENLPTERQTLLFSATQTRSVKDLARLSLQDPMFVSVHENSSESTPAQLEQSYVVCELHDKMSMIWSFLKNHLKAKILVFLTSCKQVRYIHEAIKRLQPGIPVLALHGGMPQLRRVEVYNQFVVKQRACLFATDIAARGLDFPAVNWVVQLDCPEDANTYIHRAGRTARYQEDGQSLLVLLPSEENGMIKQLTDKKIPIEQIRINMKRLYSIQAKLESNCAADPELKDAAQRAFVTYLRSVFLMSNKQVFDVHSVDLDKYASSLGLAVAPRVRFLKKEQQRQKQLAQKQNNVNAKKMKKKTNEMTESELARVTEKLKSGLKEGDLSEGDDDDDSNEEEDSSEEDSEDTNSEDGSSDEDSEKLNLSNANREEITENKSNTTQTKAKANKKGQDKTDEIPNKSKVKQKSTSDSESDSNDSDSGDSDSNDSDSNDSDSSENDNSEESDSADERIKQSAGKATFDFGVDDDGDDLFKVKKNVDIDKLLGTQGEEEEMVSNKSKKKAMGANKEALARKLIRKKIQVNTKVIFDDEGQVTMDPNKVLQVDIDIERADDTGGIDIELAKKRMKAEDKVDKQIFRQKIRQKHREERMKRKEENRAKSKRAENNDEDNDEEMEVTLAMSGDDDDDKADPLSFLPDPDKVYGKRQHSDSSDDDDDDDDNSDDDGPSSSKYGKFMASEAKRDRPPTDDEDSDDAAGVMDTELSLRDDEAIALKLLSGK